MWPSSGTAAMLQSQDAKQRLAQQQHPPVAYMPSFFNNDIDSPSSNYKNYQHNNDNSTNGMTNAYNNCLPPNNQSSMFNFQQQPQSYENKGGHGLMGIGPPQHFPSAASSASNYNNASNHHSFGNHNNNLPATTLPVPLPFTKYNTNNNSGMFPPSGNQNASSTYNNNNNNNNLSSLGGPPNLQSSLPYNNGNISNSLNSSSFNGQSPSLGFNQYLTNNYSNHMTLANKNMQDSLHPGNSYNNSKFIMNNQNSNLNNFNNNNNANLSSDDYFGTFNNSSATFGEPNYETNSNNASSNVLSNSNINNNNNLNTDENNTSCNNNVWGSNTFNAWKAGSKLTKDVWNKPLNSDYETSTIGSESLSFANRYDSSNNIKNLDPNEQHRNTSSSTMDAWNRPLDGGGYNSSASFTSRHTSESSAAAQLTANSNKNNNYDTLSGNYNKSQQSTNLQLAANAGIFDPTFDDKDITGTSIWAANTGMLDSSANCSTTDNGANTKPSEQNFGLTGSGFEGLNNRDNSGSHNDNSTAYRSSIQSEASSSADMNLNEAGSQSSLAPNNNSDLNTNNYGTLVGSSFGQHSVNQNINSNSNGIQCSNGGGVEDDMIRQLVNAPSGWGQNPVKQDTSWDSDRLSPDASDPNTLGTHLWKSQNSLNSCSNSINQKTNDPMQHHYNNSNNNNNSALLSNPSAPAYNGQYNNANNNVNNNFGQNNGSQMQKFQGNFYNSKTGGDMDQYSGISSPQSACSNPTNHNTNNLWTNPLSNNNNSNHFGGSGDNDANKTFSYNKGPHNILNDDEGMNPFPSASKVAAWSNNLTYNSGNFNSNPGNNSITPSYMLNNKSNAFEATGTSFNSDPGNNGNGGLPPPPTAAYKGLYGASSNRIMSMTDQDFKFGGNTINSNYINGGSNTNGLNANNTLQDDGEEDSEGGIGVWKSVEAAKQETSMYWNPNLINNMEPGESLSVLDMVPPPPPVSNNAAESTSYNSNPQAGYNDALKRMPSLTGGCKTFANALTSGHGSSTVPMDNEENSLGWGEDKNSAFTNPNNLNNTSNGMLPHNMQVNYNNALKFGKNRPFDLSCSNNMMNNNVMNSGNMTASGSSMQRHNAPSYPTNNGQPSQPTKSFPPGTPLDGSNTTATTDFDDGTSIWARNTNPQSAQLPPPGINSAGSAPQITTPQYRTGPPTFANVLGSSANHNNNNNIRSGFNNGDHGNSSNSGYNSSFDPNNVITMGNNNHSNGSNMDAKEAYLLTRLRALAPYNSNNNRDIVNQMPSNLQELIELLENTTLEPNEALKILELAALAEDPSSKKLNFNNKEGSLGKQFCGGMNANHPSNYKGNHESIQSLITTTLKNQLAANNDDSNYNNANLLNTSIIKMLNELKSTNFFNHNNAQGQQQTSLLKQMASNQTRSQISGPADFANHNNNSINNLNGMTNNYNNNNNTNNNIIQHNKMSNDSVNMLNNANKQYPGALNPNLGNSSHINCTNFNNMNKSSFKPDNDIVIGNGSNSYLTNNNVPNYINNESSSLMIQANNKNNKTINNSNNHFNPNSFCNNNVASSLNNNNNNNNNNFAVNKLPNAESRGHNNNNDNTQLFDLLSSDPFSPANIGSSSTISNTNNNNNANIITQQLDQLNQAINSGLIDPAILNLKLSPQILLMLTQLLNLHKTSQTLTALLVQQHAEKPPTGNDDNNEGISPHLMSCEQLNMITSKHDQVKHQILQLQSAITAAVNNEAGPISSIGPTVDRTSNLAESINFNSTNNNNNNRLNDNNTGKSIDNDTNFEIADSLAAGTVDSLSDSLNPVSPSYSQKSSRLMQWKLPPPPASEANNDGATNDKTYGGELDKTLVVLTSNADNGSNNDSDKNSGGPDFDNIANSNLTTAGLSNYRSNSTSSGGASTEVLRIAEFRPGKPWTGFKATNIENDPYITPGSLASHPRNIIMQQHAAINQSTSSNLQTKEIGEVNDNTLKSMLNPIEEYLNNATKQLSLNGMPPSAANTNRTHAGINNNFNLLTQQASYNSNIQPPLKNPNNLNSALAAAAFFKNFAASAGGNSQHPLLMGCVPPPPGLVPPPPPFGFPAAGGNMKKPPSMCGTSVGSWNNPTGRHILGNAAAGILPLIGGPPPATPGLFNGNNNCSGGNLTSNTNNLNNVANALDMNKPTWLVLKNLTSQVEASALKTLCSQHGMVKKFYLNKPAGEALVLYSNRTEAGRAFKVLDSLVLWNAPIKANIVTNTTPPQ